MTQSDPPSPQFPRRLEELSELVSLCKRRGFVFASSEIYGGINACWDYGPLGVELKRQIKDRWWRAMTEREDVEGLDASILMHPKTWEASGHVHGFVDPLVDCKKCRNRFRADQLAPGTTHCPQCQGELTAARQFNLMFKTTMGALEESGTEVYLRPETAQGIFVNFLNVQQASRQKVPFGIAQIGKAFRNEITPGNFIFRTREFEQMEMQFFVPPSQDQRWFEAWREWRIRWHRDLGLNELNLRLKPHAENELAHYARAAVDVEYRFPFGWQELEGIHNRGNWDLSRHQEYSGKKLEYYDEALKEHYLPVVIETSAGCDRTLLAVLVEAYRQDDQRTWLELQGSIAPVQVAIFPLMKKPPLVELAERIHRDLKKSFRVQWDDVGSIGKRYRRQDEIGTPWGVTVDYQSLDTQSVTLRNRDTMQQQRISAAQLVGFLEQSLDGRP